MSSLQRACAVAVVLWLAVHGLMAVFFADRSDAPVLSLASWALCVAASLWVAAPGIFGGDGDMPCWQGWFIAALVPVIGTLVAPFLGAEDLRSYANWWPSPVGIIIAGLALRRHPAIGACAAAGACAVIVISVITTTPAGSPADVLTIALLTLPPPLWWTGGYAARHLLDRTDEAVSRFSAAEAEARLRAAQAAARSQRADQHRAALADTAVPVLIRLARGDLEADGTLRDTSRRLERVLRDDLRGKALLNADIRRAAAQARARGAVVSFVDDSSATAQPGLITKVRPLVVAALNAMHRGQLTVRLRPDGQAVTMAIDGRGGDMTAIGEALARTSRADNLTTEVDHSADDLWAELKVHAEGEEVDHRLRVDAPTRPAEVKGGSKVTRKRDLPAPPTP